MSSTVAASLASRNGAASDCWFQQLHSPSSNPSQGLLFDSKDCSSAARVGPAMVKLSMLGRFDLNYVTTIRDKRLV
jgi:hypothetical protein